MDSFKLFQSNNLKFLFSFSLLCALFSLLPLFSQSLKPFLMQFFSNIIEKTCMFLLCNTLLAFIALYSTIVNPSSSTTHESIQVVLDNEKSFRFEFYKSESEITESIDGDNLMESESQAEENEEVKSLVIVEQESVIIDEDETEKLNKKCEDFIKKMKAAFCSDSRAENKFYFDYDQKSESEITCAC